MAALVADTSKACNTCLQYLAFLVAHSESIGVKKNGFSSHEPAIQRGLRFHQRKLSESSDKLSDTLSTFNKINRSRSN